MKRRLFVLSLCTLIHLIDGKQSKVICEAGFWCPSATTDYRENICGGNAWYCPDGSAERILVDEGYYSIGDSELTRIAQKRCEPGFFCRDGVKKPCRAGTFQPDDGFGECDNVCPRGYYCPEGSSEPTKCPPGTFGNETGLSSSKCSGLCEPGFYCDKDTINVSPTQTPCPGGVLGKSHGLISSLCSSKCDSLSHYCIADTSVCRPGYYCPSATTVELECGSAGVFCPAGSAAPTTVQNGYYSFGGSSPSTNKVEKICEKGHYCVNGEKFPCPAGTFGATEGLSTSACSGRCTAGFVCPEGSISSHHKRCGAVDKYCPEGSSIPVSAPAGYYTTGSGPLNRQSQVECEPGFYCPGNGLRKPCPAGTYGESSGLKTETCSGLCPLGHFCPSKTVNPNTYPCPAGTYGASRGLHDASCSGPCHEGYYCKSGSVSATQYRCNAQITEGSGIPGDTSGTYTLLPVDSVYCPEGSSAPIPVSENYYAAGGSMEGGRTFQIKCPTNPRTLVDSLTDACK